MQIETRGMTKGQNENELRDSLKVLNLSEREERYIIERSGILNLLFANH